MPQLIFFIYAQTSLSDIHDDKFLTPSLRSEFYKFESFSVYIYIYLSTI